MSFLACVRGDERMMPGTCLNNGPEDAGGENGIMLFGVRLISSSSSGGSEVNSFRKSASMTNLSQYQPPQQQDSSADAGYASDDVVHPSSAPTRDRKRGIPWTEEEHKLFLLGLEKVGKGDWRGISRNFVKTRTPTQVASHAQKYFLRRTNQNRRRRRSSLFDITTPSTNKFTSSSAIEEEEQNYGDFPIPPSSFPLKLAPAEVPLAGGERPMGDFNLLGPQAMKISAKKPVRSILPAPPSQKMASLNLNQKSPAEPLPVSLKHPSPSSDNMSPAATSHSSALQAMSSGQFSGNGDSIISVA